MIMSVKIYMFQFELILFKQNMQTTEIPQRITLANTNNPAVGPKVSALRGDIVNENSEFLHQQVRKMKDFQQRLGNILTQISQNKIACQQTINNLNTQISDLDRKVNNYQGTMNSNAEQQFHNQIRGYNHELKNVYDQRIALAKDINIKKLSKIQIDDKKSPANELFKWILVSMYNEPQSKYFWPNFQDEALVNDKGVDFVERLGKINATKQQHKMKTESFLNDYPTIVSAPELKNNQEDVQKLYKIAQLFKKGYTLNNSVKDTQQAIVKHKQSTMQKDEEFMRWKARSEALKDRIQINQSYLQVLNDTESKLIPKANMYNEKIASGQTLRNEFENFGKWSPTINLDTQKKNNCECSIF